MAANSNIQKYVCLCLIPGQRKDINFENKICVSCFVSYLSNMVQHERGDNRIMSSMANEFLYTLVNVCLTVLLVSNVFLSISHVENLLHTRGHPSSY